ncbi:BCCT family transporter [Oceanimonas sp. MB9]|uniref:BCCT family transporter n=1 Tax=Oceanimonas sp. MB9 TaxID=2588453 RepID=UPI0013F5D149|nr:BCCT family transporter [Oceanimonas sp. MB9]NHI01666.1 Glycine betaine transporter OpuD [Oceanimonas sp. MB9]
MEAREVVKVKDLFDGIKIKVNTNGFYQGYSMPVSVISKFVMSSLLIWALIWPQSANESLGITNTLLLGWFNEFYILTVGGFAFFLLLIAFIPVTGKRILGKQSEKPEFSTISWFSMMFGAGLGVGLMVYSTAEPVGLWGSNPAIVAGEVEPYSADALTSSFRYAFTHFGFHMWAIYVVVGLTLAYLSYSRGLPLTIRTALTPLFGRRMNGMLGHVFDIMGMVATILGISVTIGFGVSQFVDGMYAITDMAWLVKVTDGQAPQPSIVGLLTALFLIMSLSIISAVSGVGKGIKYLSNLNLVLSMGLLLTFVIFGSFLFATTTYASALGDYLLHLVEVSFSAYPTDTPLGDWQKGWTTFYWAWQIAFAPFVGLFLARISRGRSLREFVLGAMIAPALFCFVWLVVVGGTAIDAELSGLANGAIINASVTNMLFENLRVLLGNGLFLNLMTIMCLVLIVTFLVTSSDSGILVLNTISSGGNVHASVRHRVLWGVLLTLLIASLLIAGSESGTDPRKAIQNAMVIGALPFNVVMVMMCLSLGKVLFIDCKSSKKALKHCTE